MDMSPDYMRKTSEHLAAQGFQLETLAHVYGPEAEPAGRGTRYALQIDPQIALKLESISYPDGKHAYYLEIENYFGMRSYSFQLDSWKHFADRVEFKYMAAPDTGLGLTFILYFAKIPGLKPAA